ncbi:MAG: hypothetical protein IJ206_06570 [Oscillospiraceae bacterium]|nr:hypothetical protein [Oscillospiraceae bacterium]
MKTSLKNVELKALIPVTPVAVSKEVEIARQLISRLDHRKVKQYALTAVGAACGIKLVSAISRELSYQTAVSKQIKRHLEPVQAQLDQIIQQNAELKEQNERLHKRLDAIESGAAAEDGPKSPAEDQEEPDPVTEG